MKPFPGLQEAIDWGRSVKAGEFCCLIQWQGFKPPMPVWRERVSTERETGVIVGRKP